MIDALAQMLIECAEPNWDGYGAEPVTLDTVNRARKFVALLPPDIPAPGYAPDADGEVSCEWYKEGSVLSVSAGERLAFAYLINGESGHGVLVISPIAISILSGIVREHLI